MKKLILLFVLLLGSTMSIFAQNYKEVVYLKNGSIIKGIIVEQVPNISLKIQTADGSLFVYKMSEVEKVTKEVVEARRLNQFNKKSAKGYKGFVETGYSLGIGDYSYNRFELSTSHGYKFNSYLFLGAGVGLCAYETDDIAIPFFADFRVNFSKDKITPIGGIKLGYSLGDFEGVYGSIDIGVRFGLSGKKAMTVKFGCTEQDFVTKPKCSIYNIGGQVKSICSQSSSAGTQAISLKVGVEF